ncbi:energy-coupling factor ABC transporter permease [Marinicellulosiphila megalodicopiae]|uniref:energy-coupling factor ABC transporter permease n=1 Tax=Marinicellulosiphila megalodicopiae TaxID=2724896 RepID=UPI003BAE3DFA
MHIEPGVVDGAKILLSLATAATAFVVSSKHITSHVKQNGVASLATKTLLATVAVLVFFEVFPKQPVGVSEVHLILGSSIFLLFSLAPAALGLTFGLLIQSLFFAQTDLPQYFMNITTLLVPLFAMAAIAPKFIDPNTAYSDLTYTQTLKLSAIYQSGIVAWVMFWAFYGQGFAVETFVNVGVFAAAYLTVIIVEPVADLALLFAAKRLKPISSLFVNTRLYKA